MATVGMKEEEKEEKRREPTFYVLNIDFTYIISYDLHISLCGIISFYR